MPAPVFSAGTEIDHLGGRLHLQECIATGLTGEVYKARLTLPDERQVEVAVKVMRELDFPLAHRLFREEAETLAWLMNLEEEEKDFLDESLKIAPVFYGLSEAQVPQGEIRVPYIVMEFVKGISVPERLRTQGPFSEPQALIAAWHLYRILYLLHEHLQKSFVDLKFENLRWVDDPQRRGGGQIKILDFGTLEKLREGEKQGIQRDILLAGVYLFALLTGQMLPYSFGELRQPAEPLIERFYRREGRFSWGTYHLLRHLLHRNPEARYSSTPPILDQIRQLVEFWTLSPEDLQKMVQKMLIRAEHRSPEDPNLRDEATNTYAALDVLSRRAPHLYDERDGQRARALLRQSDYLQQALALLQGRSYRLARQYLEEGIPFSEEPHRLRHWAYVAQIGEEVPSTALEARFEDIHLLLDTLHDNLDKPNIWKETLQGLQNLEKPFADQPDLKSEGLSLLITECEIYDLLTEAHLLEDQQKFLPAAERYARLRELLNRMPPQVARQIIEELGPIAHQERVLRLKSAEERAQQEYVQAKEALAHLDLSLLQETYHVDNTTYSYQEYRILDFVFCAWREAPFAPFHSSWLADLIEQTLQLLEDHPSQADALLTLLIRLLEWAARIDRNPSPLQAYLPLLEPLQEAARALSTLNGYALGLAIEAAWKILPPEKRPALASLIQWGAERALQVGHMSFLQRMIELAQRLFPDLSTEVWQQRVESYTNSERNQHLQSIDSLLKELQSLLFPLLPLDIRPQTLQQRLNLLANWALARPPREWFVLRSQAARLEQARQIMAHLQVLRAGDPHRQEEIKAWEHLLRHIESTQRTLDHLDTTRPSRWEEKIHSLELRRSELKREVPPATANWEAGWEKVAEFLQTCLTTLDDLERLQDDALPSSEKARYRQKLEEYQEWAQDALDSFGIATWKKVSDLAGKRYQALEQKYTAIEQALQQGQLSRAVTLLEGLPSSLQTDPRYRTLHEQIARISEWQAWLDAHRHQLEQHDSPPNLLDDLYHFRRHLPEAFWKSSPAVSYLTGLRKQVQHRMQRMQQRSPNHPEFIEWLKLYLYTMWIEHGAQPAPDSDSQWVTEAYRLARQRKWNELWEWLDHVPVPSDPQATLSHFPSLWKEAEKQVESSLKPRIPPILRYALASLALIAIGVLGLFGWWSGMIPSLRPAPTATAGLILPTLTPSATPTPAPPTETPTPTPTFTPTPILPSGYEISPELLSSQTPPPMTSVQAAWLLNASHAILAPPEGWKEESTYKYIGPTQGAVAVTWKMDQPFNAEGYYQILVYDTITYSGKLPWVTFKVLLDGQEISPLIGDSRVYFRAQFEGWHSIGIYFIQAGQRLTVQSDPVTIHQGGFFAVDRLLILRLTDRDRRIVDALRTLLPAGQTPLLILDETFVDSKDIKKLEEVSTPLAWNNHFRRIKKGTRYTWKSQNKFSPGKYAVYLWLPELPNGTSFDIITFQFDSITTKNLPFGSITANNLLSCTMGCWIWIGEVDLKNDTPPDIQLTLTISSNQSGTFPLDALAVVRINE